MEHEFPFKTYRPEKQDYFFIFSIALANDLKRPVPLLSNRICRKLFEDGKQPIKHPCHFTYQSLGCRRVGLSITLYGTVTVVGVAPGAACA